MRRSTWAGLLVADAALAASSTHAAQTGLEPVYDPATRTYTVTEPPSARWPAPGIPIGYGAAFRHWDGTGELFLAPDRDKWADAEYGIGATFDDGDATADDRSADGTDRRCPAMEGTYRVRDGGLAVSQGVRTAGPQGARVSSGPRQPGLVFATERCRYRVVLSTKIRAGDHWVDAPLADVPPPKLPTFSGKAIRLEAGQSFVMKAAPSPQELLPWRATSGTGARLADGAAEACPDPSGTIDFEPRGVFLTQRWPPQGTYAPGVSRDVEGRATTLIFQGPTCREEIRVSRDVKVDGVWRSSPLSPAPGGSAMPESRRGVQD